MQVECIVLNFKKTIIWISLAVHIHNDNKICLCMENKKSSIIQYTLSTPLPFQPEPFDIYMLDLCISSESWKQTNKQTNKAVSFMEILEWLQINSLEIK